MMNNDNLFSETVIAGIRQADDGQIGEICLEVMKRYRVLFPDSEILFLNLPKNDTEERNRLLNQMITLLRAES